MKFKESYFSLSLPLIKENLRRFWAIPAICFLLYFLSGAVPILMSYNHINDMSDYIQMCLTNQQPFYMAIHLIMPVITAVIVFRYLQTASSVTAMHSLPFTRATLYNSGVLSGLILSILPILANGIILLVIAKPTYFVYDNILSKDAVNLFSRLNVLNWFWHSLIIIAVVYAISVFAGLITGNSIMHLAAAFGFNFLVPALYGTFIAYCVNYLFGFSSSGSWEDILFGITPYFQVISSEGHFSIGLQLYYIINALVLFVLCGLLYQKRKLERTSDSLVFNFMIPIICYLIAFFGMSLIGFYFTLLATDEGQDHGYMYAGLVAGAVIFFILGRMIVMKTPRVFNKQSLKSFGIYAVLAAIFVVSITLDLTGFESRVPNPSKVSGVYSTTFSDFNDVDRFSPSFFNTGDNSNDPNTIIISNGSELLYYTDPKNIEALTMLHKDILKNRKNIESMDYTMSSQSVDINYTNGFPLGMQRSYTLDYDFIASNTYCKQLFESKEYKSFFSLNNLNCERIISINLQDQLSSLGYDSAGITIADSAKIDELFDCLEKDFQNRTFEQHISCLHEYATASISYKSLDENGKLVDNALQLRVLQSDSNTIDWINSNGYIDWLNTNGYTENFVIDPVQVKSITFYKYNQREQDEYNSKLLASEAQTVENIERISTEPSIVITDKAQIQEILNTYCSTQSNYDEYYHGLITFVAGVNSDMNYSNWEKYEEYGYSYDNNTFGEIYYTYDNAPRFLSNYLK